MAARVCEPIAASIAPGEIARRASATCASNTSRTGRGNSVGDAGATTIGFNVCAGFALVADCKGAIATAVGSAGLIAKWSSHENH